MPIRGDFGQGHQNKGAILQAGMGKNQSIGRDLALLVGSKIGPLLPDGGIGQNGVPHGQKIKIKRAPSPAGGSCAAKLRFDGVQMGQDLSGGEIGLQAGCGVNIVRPCTGRETGRLEKAAGLHGW